MPELLQEIEEPTTRLSEGSGGFPPYGFQDGRDSWHPNRRPRSTYAIGMFVACAGSSMFFAALISAAVVHKGLPGSNWMTLEAPSILWVTSSLAIASSITMTQARRLFKAGDNAGFSRWWKATAVLGLLFLCGQVFAWRQLAAIGVYIRTNPSVSFFYVFTAAHGLHLLGGVVALLWIAYRPGLAMSRATATSVASIYWHFVTVLWLFLFSFFLIGG
jgi:cytochrome c oxidase subunit III